MSDKIILNVKELAQELGVSLPTAYELCRRHDFPSIRINKRILIPVLEFRVWLSDQARKAV